MANKTFCDFCNKDATVKSVQLEMTLYERKHSLSGVAGHFKKDACLDCEIKIRAFLTKLSNATFRDAINAAPAPTFVDAIAQTIISLQKETSKKRSRHAA